MSTNDYSKFSTFKAVSTVRGFRITDIRPDQKPSNAHHAMLLCGSNGEEVAVKNDWFCKFEPFVGGYFYINEEDLPVFLSAAKFEKRYVPVV